MATVSFQNIFAALVGGTITGVRCSDVTAVIKNQLRQTQETLVFPGGITEIEEGGSYSYHINDFDVSSLEHYPGTYIVVEWSGVVATPTLNTGTITQVVPIRDAEPLPEIPPGYAPYADIGYSLAYWDKFGLPKKRRLWNDLLATSPSDAHRYLMAATDDLDREAYKGFRIRWTGYPTTLINYTSRKWPRNFGAMEESIIYYPLRLAFTPDVIKYACCVQALHLYTMDLTGQDYEQRRFLQSQGLTGISIGKSSESWDLARAPANNICPAAYQYIREYLAYSVSDSVTGFY